MTMDEMKKEAEIWLDIPGYENIYQASNCGRIKSLQRMVNNNGGARFINERIMRPCLDYHGYYRLELSNLGIRRKYFVHQLIAVTFLPNPNNYKIINHKDGKKINNKPNNIEWCDYSHNEKHSYRVLGKKPTCPGAGKFGIDSSQSKPLTQFTKSGTIIAHFVSLKAASDSVGGLYTSIAKAVEGKRKTFKGFIWEYGYTN